MLCTASSRAFRQPGIRPVGYWSMGEQVTVTSADTTRQVPEPVPAAWTHYIFLETIQKDRISTGQDQCRVSSQSSQFELLVKSWRTERGYTSSVTRILACPSYQKIIDMGKEAVPLILGQLKREGDDPDLWFKALEVLTGENPVPKEAQGNMKRMAIEWLRWGVTH